MEDHFNGIVGQRYKLHRAKGYDSGNMEGKDPNRFFFSGVYAGTQVSVNPAGVSLLFHLFTDCVWPPGVSGSATKSVLDLGFSEGVLIAVKEASGGRRKRTRHQRRHKRRLTRRRRA